MVVRITTLTDSSHSHPLLPLVPLLTTILLFPWIALAFYFSYIEVTIPNWFLFLISSLAPTTTLGAEPCLWLSMPSINLILSMDRFRNHLHRILLLGFGQDVIVWTLLGFSMSLPKRLLIVSSTLTSLKLFGQIYTISFIIASPHAFFRLINNCTVCLKVPLISILYYTHLKIL